MRDTDVMRDLVLKSAHCELLVIVLNALGFTILGNKRHCVTQQVAKRGHVAVPLAEGLSIDAKIARGGGLLPGLSPSNGFIHKVPGLVPADPQQPAGAVV
jgi:hypothetical protein